MRGRRGSETGWVKVLLEVSLWVGRELCVVVCGGSDLHARKPTHKSTDIRGQKKKKNCPRFCVPRFRFARVRACRRVCVRTITCRLRCVSKLELFEDLGLAPLELVGRVLGQVAVEAAAVAACVACLASGVGTLQEEENCLGGNCLSSIRQNCLSVLIGDNENRS